MICKPCSRSVTLRFNSVIFAFFSINSCQLCRNSLRVLILIRFLLRFKCIVSSPMTQFSSSIRRLWWAIFSSQADSLSLATDISSSIISEWENLGILLGIEDAKLLQIKSGYHGDNKACLCEMLRIWPKSVSPPPSWPAIAMAAAMLGHQALADQLISKYSVAMSPPRLPVSTPIVIATGSGRLADQHHRVLVEQLSQHAAKWREIGGMCFSQGEQNPMCSCQLGPQVAGSVRCYHSGFSLSFSVSLSSSFLFSATSNIFFSADLYASLWTVFSNLLRRELCCCTHCRLAIASGTPKSALCRKELSEMRVLHKLARSPHSCSISRSNFCLLAGGSSSSKISSRISKQLPSVSVDSWTARIKHLAFSLLVSPDSSTLS